MIDELIHDFYRQVVPLYNLNWRRFEINNQDLNYYSDEELSTINVCYRFYYAGDDLYVIKDTRLNSIYFTYARIPEDALKNFFKDKDRWRMRNNDNS